MGEGGGDPDCSEASTGLLLRYFLLEYGYIGLRMYRVQGLGLL